MLAHLFYDGELPKADDHIPLVNRPETVRGVVITFMVGILVDWIKGLSLTPA